MSHNKEGISNMQPALPAPAILDAELSQAETLEEFFGKDGLLSQLFARAVETILEGELTAQLGYDRYESKGRNTGNNL